MATEQTYEISDLDGSNKRRVTLAQFRAEIDAAKAQAEAIFAADRRAYEARKERGDFA